ncbi:MAG: NAD(P)H-dependent oxidoreductase subunit E [Synergistaceae bacterium]|jgi:NADH-quinone oxidoreductase subunit E|nr:NAD(P)H-dependent oxidoreductase subunit E [Synergistaceae bacterium]
MNLSIEDMRKKVLEIIVPWRGREGGLIPILQALQGTMGYVAEPAAKIVSEELKIPMSEIYSVVTFYAQFHLTPRGRHVIRVCRGTACHVRGSLKILDAIKEQTGCAENGTTEDLRFSLEPVACLGACGLAPVMVVDGQTFGRATPDGVSAILAQFS